MRPNLAALSGSTNAITWLNWELSTTHAVRPRNSGEAASFSFPPGEVVLVHSVDRAWRSTMLDLRERDHVGFTPIADCLPDIVRTPDTTPDVLNNCRSLVHPLLFCPPLVKGTYYVLVRRTAIGGRIALLKGRAQS